MKNLVTLLIGIFLVVLSAMGFVFGFMSAAGKFDNEKIEFPLSDINSIAVDNQGRLYCGLGFYSRVQIYDQNGKFIKSWYVDTLQGQFDINFDERARMLLVDIFRDNRRLYFNSNGTLIKTEHVDELDYQKKIQTFDKFGNKYIVKSNILHPIIVKKHKAHMIYSIKTPFYLWLLLFPFPSFVFAVIGLLLSGYVLFVAPASKH